MNAAEFVALGSSGPPAESGPLTVVNHRLVGPDGVPKHLVGVTAFALAYYWLTNKPKAQAFIDRMSGYGLRAFVVLLTFANPAGIPALVGGILDPRQWPQFWTAIDEIVAYVASAGARTIVTAFADKQFPPLDSLDGQQFWAATQACCNVWPTAIAALANEAPSNGINPNDFNTALTLADRGSMGGEQQPFSPPWALASYETGRDDEWPRKCKDLNDNYFGNNANPPSTPNAVRFLDYPTALWVREPIKIGDTQISGSQTNDPWAVWQFTAGCRAFGSVITIAHLYAGESCDLPAPGSPSEACLLAAVDAGQLPLEAWAFTDLIHGNANDTNPDMFLHHHDAGQDSAGAVRTYQQGPTPDGRYLLMVFQPEANWQAAWNAARPSIVLASYAYQGRPATVFVVQPT